MKNTNVCPKCGSDRIVAPRLAIAPAESFEPIPTAASGAARVQRYVCADCGYVEFWVEQKDLPELRKRYKHSEF